MDTAFYLVDELKIKIEQLVKPSELNSLDSQSREILKLVYEHLDSFEETAKTTLLRTDLEKAIRSEVRKLRGIVAQIGSVEFSKDYVEGLKQGLHSFTVELKMEEQRCADGLYNTFPDDEEGEKSSDTVTSEMIGARDVYEQLKHKIMSNVTGYAVSTLVGMPGIGKTTIANNLFYDPTIRQHFECCSWIRAGKRYRLKDIPRRILAEIDPDALPGLEDGKAVQEHLKGILKSKRYFIVLDDVWDKHITCLWHFFLRYIMRKLSHPLIHWKSESRILLTSRLQQLNNTRKSFGLLQGVVAMRLLNKHESWDLFRDKVFGKGVPCPPQLVKVGKKIAEKCEGLPLTIHTVARLLSQEDNSTPEFWNEVAVKKYHPLFIDAYDEISKVMLPSYTYLPPLLQMCFLYIGLFPPKYEIPRTKLINLWLADRFLELNININSDVDAIDFIEELVTNSLVMVYKKSITATSYTVKTCGLHSSLWHLSKQKATETKFALIICSPDDCVEDDMKGYQRLSLHSNALFGMKEVHQSVEDNCASTARSLLCFGPYHQYQVPLCFRLKLLKELDALSIRFYDFPTEVLQLVRLTYLSLTSNGIIPSYICQLQLLEFLIVERHQSIKSCKDAIYLPVEIWRLSKLKHLQVMGSDLPDPCGASLDNLSTLSKVSDRSCTKAVLKGVRNIRELYIQIELAPDEDAKPLNWADIFSQCDILLSLKYVILNPNSAPPVVLFPSFALNFLTDLCLSGLGYPWKEMRKIALLPHLNKLKLKYNAFQGPNWIVGDYLFGVLRSLVIEDADMVDWKIGGNTFTYLRCLVIRNCYKLKRIYGKFGKGMREIEIVDCNPPLTKEIENAIPEEANSWVLNVHSSWEKKKLKTTYGSPVIQDLHP